VKKILAGGAASVLVVPVLVVVLFAGADCSPAVAQSGSGVAAASVKVDELPVKAVGSYSGVQLVNAAYIMNAGQALGLDARGQALGVMTAMGESSLTVVDNGDIAGPDSRGLFQQRANGAWGAYEDRMNPTISATNFFTKLMAVDNWQGLDPSIAAHRVQVNADPYHYEKYWASAVEIVSALSGVQLNASAGGGPGASACAVGATGEYAEANGAKPGKWGGFDNGRVDPSAVVAIPWTTDQSYVGAMFLRPDAVQALTAMNNAYRVQFGSDIPINDGYRDYDGQVEAKRIYGGEAATAGTSNHGWALAIDIGTPSHARIAYYDTTYNWLVANAGTYGWVHPDWAKPGGSGPHEAWHWEFYGVKTNA
jgi:hypothetical protein